ncbi:antibiotic biosynthesis monooxygenase [Gracilibacillus caseinilyticus]|uniref:Antibiotic biosynthesis monooxygenase n=1 Tax=Gracilibacillus caseinilyticus TaxID=2932256 RepID=A0ABY4F0V7_9BACI|nr:putative quinol monooxygenase [Gracilibacillus caseinilyticus]UOQ50301.1 antibiotic biosynthesis monooxygenase [Gracilibacillus caseinilyticus]
MIIIIARMQVDPLYLEDFKEKVNALIKASQAEKGNISYSLFKGVSQTNEFVMIEKWEGEEAIEAHNKSLHLKEFIAYTKKVLLQPLDIDKCYSI